MSKLTINNISAGYGSVQVLHDVTLDVQTGETVVLLGTNGNGKSTLLKSVMGLISAVSVTSILSQDDEGKTLLFRTDLYKRVYSGEVPACFIKLTNSSGF